MVFSSLEFLFLFLPAVLLLYFAVPHRFKNLLLLLGSLFFYAWGEPIYIALMVVSFSANYVLAIAIDTYRGTTESTAAEAVASGVAVSSRSGVAVTIGVGDTSPPASSPVHATPTSATAAAIRQSHSPMTRRTSTSQPASSASASARSISRFGWRRRGMLTVRNIPDQVVEGATPAPQHPRAPHPR